MDVDGTRPAWFSPRLSRIFIGSDQRFLFCIYFVSTEITGSWCFKYFLTWVLLY